MELDGEPAVLPGRVRNNELQKTAPFVTSLTHEGVVGAAGQLKQLDAGVRIAPIGAAVLYPMLALSGLFFPVDRLPRALQAVAYLLPTTHAVALLQGVWNGSGWGAHWVNVAALLALFAAYTALSTKVFRWE